MHRSIFAGFAAALMILPSALPAQAQFRGGGAQGGAPIFRPGVGGRTGGGVRPGGAGGFNRGGFAGGAARPGAGGAPFRPGFAGNPNRGVAGNQGFRQYGDRRGRGAAIGAGLAGLAAGAVIGGALANQGSYNNGYYNNGYNGGYAYDGYDNGIVDDPNVADNDDPTAYCESRYRSYDPDSGTYLGNDGLRHPCP